MRGGRKPGFPDLSYSSFITVFWTTLLRAFYKPIFEIDKKRTF